MTSVLALWYAAFAILVTFRSFYHARCGFWEAVFAGLFWPIWLVGMAFRIGEESVGFRWPDEPADVPQDSPQARPAPDVPRDQSMTAQDKSRFLVDLSHVDLKYGDAIDIYNLLADKAKNNIG